MAQLLAKPANGLGDNDMSKIENLLAPGEQIVYRGRFGGTRLLVEVFAASITLVISAAMGPLGLFVGTLVLVAWIYGERTLQKVVVTNRRLIHKKPRFGMQVDEINLTQIESIKDNGQRLIVHGTGGTRVKLPYFLKDKSAVRNAISNPQNENTPTERSAEGPSTTELEPFWKRHKIVTGLLVYLALSISMIPFLEDDVGKGEPVESSSNIQTALVEEPGGPISPTDDLEPQRRPLETISYVRVRDRMGNLKRSLVVGLVEPVDEQSLTVIARTLQAEEPNVERTFIEYNLPGMPDATGPWATSHFNPDLRVRILGMSREEFYEAQRAR